MLYRNPDPDPQHATAAKKNRRKPWAGPVGTNTSSSNSSGRISVSGSTVLVEVEWYTVCIELAGTVAVILTAAIGVLVGALIYTNDKFIMKLNVVFFIRKCDLSGLIGTRNQHLLLYNFLLSNMSENVKRPIFPCTVNQKWTPIFLYRRVRWYLEATDSEIFVRY